MKCPNCGGRTAIDIDLHSEGFTPPYAPRCEAKRPSSVRTEVNAKRSDPRTNVRIVDWRDGPLARLYFDYDEEDEFEDVEVVGQEVRFDPEPPAQFDRRPVRHRELVHDTEPHRVTEGGEAGCTPGQADHPPTVPLAAC